MLFIHPMWDSENQRLGMKACTRLGYNLRTMGDSAGFFGVILFLMILIYLAFQFLVQRFSKHELWLLLVPFVVAVIGKMFFKMGWRFAAKKQFRYDNETRTARWIEAGHEKVFPQN